MAMPGKWSWKLYCLSFNNTIDRMSKRLAGKFISSAGPNGKTFICIRPVTVMEKTRVALSFIYHHLFIFAGRNNVYRTSLLKPDCRFSRRIGMSSSSPCTAWIRHYRTSFPRLLFPVSVVWYKNWRENHKINMAAKIGSVAENGGLI